jgi:hypothetical protein
VVVLYHFFESDGVGNSRGQIFATGRRIRKPADNQFERLIFILDDFHFRARRAKTCLAGNGPVSVVTPRRTNMRWTSASDKS